MGFIPYQEALYSNATRHGIYPEARLYPMMLGSMCVLATYPFDQPLTFRRSASFLYHSSSLHSPEHTNGFTGLGHVLPEAYSALR